MAPLPQSEPDHYNARPRLLLLNSWRHTREAPVQQPEAGSLHPAVYRMAMRLHENPAEVSLSARDKKAMTAGCSQSPVNSSRIRFPLPFGAVLSCCGDGRIADLAEERKSPGF